MRYEYKKEKRKNALRWGLAAPILGIAAWIAGAQAGKTYCPAVFGIKPETKTENAIGTNSPTAYSAENRIKNEPNEPNDLEKIITTQQTPKETTPQTLETNHQPKVVVLDPGHGTSDSRYDPGAVSGITLESDIVYKQATIIKKMLEQKGYEVHLTRREDECPTFPERRKIAEDLKEQGREVILVSLHANSVEDKSAHGQEVYYRQGEQSKALARYILESIIESIEKTGIRTNDRGVKQANYRVLNTKVTSVLTEPAFLSHHAGENKKGDYDILTDDNPDVERGIVEGIEKYFTNSEN